MVNNNHFFFLVYLQRALVHQQDTTMKKVAVQRAVVQAAPTKLQLMHYRQEEPMEELEYHMCRMMLLPVHVDVASLQHNLKKTLINASCLDYNCLFCYMQDTTKKKK